MFPLSTTARLYLRPTGFIDAPFGFDGQFARLAGGMQFFSRWEVIAYEAGHRVGTQLVAVEAMDAFVATLSDTQAERATLAMSRATSPRQAMELGSRTIRFDQPQVMAILNITPDSFSGGSEALDEPARAADLAFAMTTSGAAIIDIGGESTRPGAQPVWEEDEKARVVPVIARLAAAGTAISLDTRKAYVMEAGLAAGAHIINDVSALLYDKRSLEVVAARNCPIVIMHFTGTPQEPHGKEMGPDPLVEIYDWLEARINALTAAGIARERLIVDPGIGFGKASVAGNLAILNGLALLHGLGCPILLGASRKRLIGALSQEEPATERLGGSIALALKGAEQGAQLLRVHDVKETVQALRIWRGMRDAALTPV
jgi:dihydropteroate synthase